MPRKDLKVKIRVYKDDILDLPFLRLGVLRLVDEKIIEASGDPIDILMRISEEESKSKRGSYIEIEVISPETTYTMGEAPRYRWRKRLTFKPERLLRVGILRREPGVTGTIVNFKVDDLEWFEISSSDKIYVFEGTIEPKLEDIFLIVLDTEEGRSYIKPVSSSKSRKSSQTPH